MYPKFSQACRVRTQFLSACFMFECVFDPAVLGMPGATTGREWRKSWRTVGGKEEEAGYVRRRMSAVEFLSSDLVLFLEHNCQLFGWSSPHICLCSFCPLDLNVPNYIWNILCRDSQIHICHFQALSDFHLVSSVVSSENTPVWNCCMSAPPVLLCSNKFARHRNTFTLQTCTGF